MKLLEGTLVKISIITIIWLVQVSALGPDTLWTRTYGGANVEQSYSVRETFDNNYIIAGHTASYGAGGNDVYLIKTNANGDTIWTKTFGGINNDQAITVEETSDSGYILCGRTNSFGVGDTDLYLIKTDVNGDTTWTKTYGRAGRDEAYIIKQTPDLGYIIAGHSDSGGAGGFDFYLVKIDASGDTIWTKTYGGTNQELVYDLELTSDNGYIICGRTNSYGAGDFDVYVIKADALGDTTWTRTYGGPGRDAGISIMPTLDNGYIIVGQAFDVADFDGYVIRIDGSGDTLWTKMYGGVGSEELFSIQSTADQGYVIVGATDSYGAGSDDVYIVGLDSIGDTLWTTTYGGSANDCAHSIEQTFNYTYIIAGYTQSFGAGAADFYLLKIQLPIDTLWTNTYGGTGDDRGYSVDQTSDEGYVITGNTTSFSGRNDSGDVYLVRTDASGGELWTNAYGGSGDDHGHSIQQTAEGGYIIAGYTNSSGAGAYDVYLIKTNSDGDTSWTHTYGAAAGEYGYAVEQTSEGGYIIAGSTNSFGGSNDVYLIKTEADGDTLWTHTYGGVNDDCGHAVQQTAEGGYIIAGYTNSSGAGGYDVYLVKTDAAGGVTWSNNYGGAGDEHGYAVQQTVEGGYIIAGYTNSFGGDNDIYLIKTDAVGGVTWSNNYGGAGDEYGYAVEQTSEGGYIIAGTLDTSGTENSDVYVIGIDESGNLATEDIYGGPADDEGFSIQQTSDGGYIIAGFTNSSGAGGYDVYVIKTEPFGVPGVTEQESQVNIPITSHLLKIMPNPFRDKIKISYAMPQKGEVVMVIYNLLGQQVKILLEAETNSGTHEVIWDGKDTLGKELPSGVYFLRLVEKTSGNECNSVTTNKIMLLE